MGKLDVDGPIAGSAQASTAVLPDEDRFNLGAVVTVSVGHFAHDGYVSLIGPLLPLLIQKHGLSLAAAGGLATVPRWPGVLQPFMGYLADRYGTRTFVVWGPTVTALAMCTLGLAPNYLTLVALLLISGFSSSCFHPAAGAMASHAGGRHWGRASSYFMTGSELSRTVGPPFIVAVVSLFSLEGAWVAALPALAYSFLAQRGLRRQEAKVQRQASVSALWAGVRARGRALLTLIGVVTFRSLVIASFQVFFATYLVERGESLLYAGMAVAVYEGGGVVGSFAGGQVSDRFGRRSVMALSQLLAGPLLYGALIWSGTSPGLVALCLGGMLALSAGPVQLTLAQELLPGNRSVASGIIMFLSFEGSIFATLFIGFFADAVGLQNALAWSVLASMLSLPFTLLLPETRPAGRGD